MDDGDGGSDGGTPITGGDMRYSRLALLWSDAKAAEGTLAFLSTALLAEKYLQRREVYTKVFSTQVINALPARCTYTCKSRYSVSSLPSVLYMVQSAPPLPFVYSSRPLG